MRLYIAGPMSGIPHFNFEAFDAMATRLRREGHDVVSPAEMDDPADREAAMSSPDGHMLNYTGATAKTWGDFLSRDVKLLADDGIEGVVVLPGWERSKGARLETFVARLVGLRVYSVEHYYGGGIGLWEVPLSTLLKAWGGEA